MNERSFETELAHLMAQVPDPDPAARLRAKRIALAEFARAHAHAAEETRTPRKQSSLKAFLTALRLTRADQSHGRAPMGMATRNTLLGSVATLSVAVLGVMLMWPTIRHGGGLPAPELPRAQDPAPKATSTEQSSAEHPSTEQRVADSEGSEIVYVEPAITSPVPEMSIDAPKLSEEAVAPEPVAPQFASALTKESEQISVTASRRPSSTPPATAITQTTTVGPVVAGIAGDRLAYSPPQYSGSAGFHGVPSTAIDPENRDKFEHFETNPLKSVADAPFSTFSIDVDTASYSFVRRQLNYGVLPPKDAVRAEEMINYFDYAWPAPESRTQPFGATIVVSDSPWTEGKKLVHIGIKGYELQSSRRPDANLVWLLDVSGSMNSPDKLPLAKQSMEVLLSSLRPTDTVAIVVYAGAAGLVLEPTRVAEKEKILRALNQLQAGGSTAGAEGIKLAYQLAESHFRKEGVNRILLATDGDFNVGITDQEQLKDYVQRQRQKGIFLSVLGFGQGNYRDSMAQALAQNGNGVAAYIDTLNEARKVLSQEASASLFTIAKDVKLQVEFNPTTVAEYRLVGYETRALRREDFNNDAVDAGDIGAGHTVTAIYEITLMGSPAQVLSESRYVDEGREEPSRGKADECGYLKIRYKLPDSDTSKLLEERIPLETRRLAAPLNRDVQFSTAVAGFAQLLRGGTYTGSLSYEDVIEQAQSSKGEDPYGYRAEFIELVRKAQSAKEM